LIGEVAAGATESALNFISDEQRGVLRSEGAGAIPKGFADGVNATFALDGFEDYGADVVVEFGLEVGYIIEFDEFDSRDERSEGQSIFFGGGDADGAESAPVKRIFKREDAVLWIRRRERRVGGTRIKAGEFEAAFDGFSAAVGEKDAVHAGDFGKLLGERTLKFVVKKIGEMDRSSRLAADDFDDVGMRVAETVDGDATEKVEIFFAV